MTTQTSEARRVALGTFDHRDKADAAVTALMAAGFSYSEIGVIAQKTSAWDDLVRSDAAVAETNPATGALAGATAGAGVGGLWALGIAAGVMPAIGPVVAGGILASVLASAAAGAAAGGIGGALIGLGLNEQDANHYFEEVVAGRTVVTVRAGHRYDEAVSILAEHGAVLSMPSAPLNSEMAGSEF